MPCAKLRARWINGLNSPLTSLPAAAPRCTFSVWWLPRVSVSIASMQQVTQVVPGGAQATQGASPVTIGGILSSFSRPHARRIVGLLVSSQSWSGLVHAAIKQWRRGIHACYSAHQHNSSVHHMRHQAAQADSADTGCLFPIFRSLWPTCRLSNGPPSSAESAIIRDASSSTTWIIIPKWVLYFRLFGLYMP